MEASSAARTSSGLPYPERFYAAASYAGFSGSDDSAVGGRFKPDVAVLLYGLYQQASFGPCNVPKPRGWSPVEQAKWTSWNGLGNMASSEAMRLFVKILEEEDPVWSSRVPEFNADPVVDVEMHNQKPVPGSGSTNEISVVEPKTIPAENGSIMETQDKDVIMEGLSSVGVYDQWTQLSVSGQSPRSRYEHGAAVLQEKMYIYGGNHNGRYLSDIQVLDLKSLTWSKIETKSQVGSSESNSTILASPCAGHSLIPCQDKIISVGGHTKDPFESVTVKEFDPRTSSWSILKTYGKPPISRGGQSVTLVGSTLIVFGGEDAKRSLLNDLHILDLETMTWDDIETIGVLPSPRSDHTAACHDGRFLYIFGGGSHATCFNDLHILDLQTMEWSRPRQHGTIPSTRAGHAGVTVGDNWYIVGGGNNKSGVSETHVLNMSTLTWSVLTTVKGRVPLASEGMSLVRSTYNREDYLVAFGGYNGRYSSEVYALKLSRKSDMESNASEGLLPDGTSTVSRPEEPEIQANQDGIFREIVMDSVDSNLANQKSDAAGERHIASLRSEKEQLEITLSREQLQTSQLKQELAEAENRNTELTKELQSVRSQLAAEQSRCFKLEVDVAELRQKLQHLEALEKEVELLQRQKAASEQAMLEAKQRQSSSGVWGWLAGTPP